MHDFNRVPDILILDDDAPTREAFKAALEMENYTVVTASDSAEAFAIIASAGNPRLIFVDIQMPSVPGDEFILRIRSNPATATIPMVLMSGLMDATGARGVDVFLRKPIDLNLLLKTVRAYLPGT